MECSLALRTIELATNNVDGESRQYLRVLSSESYRVVNPAPCPLVIDPQTWEAWYNRRRLPLTPTEARMLSLVMKQPGNLVSTASFVRILWPDEPLAQEQGERRLYVLVSRLRNKLPSGWDYEMERIRKRGYVLRPRAPM
ncbi:hypothetical protein AYO38_08360 [bacterium SCGC AG-212-C10]|nr:hypothetical protein AYO38_08360 [bacterium SCGC AG-212-C10]